MIPCEAGKGLPHSIAGGKFGFRSAEERVARPAHGLKFLPFMASLIEAPDRLLELAPQNGFQYVVMVAQSRGTMMWIGMAGHQDAAR